jgi:fumarate hydratase class I
MACPPYHLAVTIGGLSAEQTMRVAKLASCRYLDHLPTEGDSLGRAFRDRTLEAELLEATRGFGFGAQLGGRYFCHDVRVVRLPRHSGCLPIGLAVSCSADRQALARIDAESVWLEDLERDPARFLPDPAAPATDLPLIDLDDPPGSVRAALSQLPVGTTVRLSGALVSARDIAHARFRALLSAGKALPDYLLRHPVYYAGPAKAPPGRPVGAFGPTTSARMDDYVPELQRRGASLIMLGKGNRSASVVDACRANGGFYLASIGGIGARLSQDFIESAEVIDHADLGMEAVWRLKVRDMPACIIVNDRGEDFYAAPTGRGIAEGKA